MATPLAEAHISAGERLRALIAAAVAQIWGSLPGYDRENLDEWLSRVVPVVLAGQRQAVALTEAYLARAIERPPLGSLPSEIIGPGLRSGTPPETVYERSFVETWTKLGTGVLYDDAIDIGRRRATNMAATDIQLATTHTLREVGEADDQILGYARVPDAGACKFCRLVAGQRYRTDELMPIHAHCGCGVDVITAANRSQFAGNRARDLSVSGAAVEEHGELGPLLVDPNHHFTRL